MPGGWGGDPKGTIGFSNAEGTGNFNSMGRATDSAVINNVQFCLFQELAHEKEASCRGQRM